MKNPPNGGLRATREVLVGKVDLGLSEIVESRPDGLLSSTSEVGPQLQAGLDLNKTQRSNPGVSLIDLDGSLNGYCSNNQISGKSSGPIGQDSKIKTGDSSTTSDRVRGKRSKFDNTEIKLLTPSSPRAGVLERLSTQTAKTFARNALFSLVVFAALGTAFVTSYAISNKDGLSPSIPFLSPPATEVNYSLRSLGILSDSGVPKTGASFTIHELVSARLPVSELDAVAYNMQREEGRASGDIKLINQTDNSRTDSPSSGKNSVKDDRSVAPEDGSEVSQKSDPLVKERQVQAAVNSRNESSARKSATRGDTRPIEINTSGPVEPQLPERETAVAKDEFRDPFARESISPSPDFPKGNEVRPILEEPLAADKVLKVHIDTTVRSKPSVFGDDLANLRAGDSVLAVSKVGQWIRIRSKKGLSGFVLERALSEGTGG